jgi:transketolase
MRTTLVRSFEDLPALLALMSGDEKHDPAALSTLDVLWVLYDQVLNVSPDTVEDPARDRFLLSKGHGPQAYFAVLAAKGFFPTEVLANFGGFDSPLGYHPDRRLVPGVEISSGSLGHGLAIAVGVALALRRAALLPRVVCLLGDAELDEGSNHEAIVLGGRFALDGLSAVVIDNDSSSYGWPGGVEERFAGEGWATQRVASNDHQVLAAALSWRSPAGTPNVVVVEATPKPNTWRSLQSATKGARSAL